MIKLIDPTRPNEQHARGLDLHLLEVGKDNNRNVLEMVKAGKNQIKVPTSFEDYLTLTQGFMGLCAIFFGTASSLTLALRKFCRSLPRSYSPLILTRH